VEIVEDAAKEIDFRKTRHSLRSSAGDGRGKFDSTLFGGDSRGTQGFVEISQDRGEGAVMLLRTHADLGIGRFDLGFRAEK
jgi:hypothetical protein